MQMLLKMYTSSDGLYPMRVKAGKEHQTIDQPSLSIIGSAVPAHYYEAMSTKMLTNGFFARLLVVEAGPRGEGQEPIFRELPACIVERAQWWADVQPGTGNLEEFHPVPVVAEYTPESKEVIASFRRKTEQEYKKAEERQDAVGMTIWSRVGQKARRLGLIYACSVDPENLLITANAVRWSTRFVHHLTRRMLFKASTHVSENPFHAECLKVMEKLREAPEGKLAHSTLLKRMKMAAKTFRELMETMGERGDIVIRDEPTSGRPARYYQLGDESAVADAIALARRHGLRDIGCYVLIGFHDTPEWARYRLETLREWDIWPNPMRFQPLDALEKDSHVGPAWTERELRRMMRYYSRLRWLEHVPYEDYRPPTAEGQTVLFSLPNERT